MKNSNRMDDPLPDAGEMDHKYIVVGKRLAYIMNKYIKGKMHKAVLALIMILALAMSTGLAFAGTQHELELHKKQTIDNARFQVENMFPGDVVTKSYNVRVSHKEAAKVHLKGEVTRDEPYQIIAGANDKGAKLADVLNVKIVLKNTGATLYEGKFSNMPASMDYEVPAVKASAKTDLVYEVTASLDTSVSNEYQAYILAADFTWWVDSEDAESLVRTGDDFPMILTCAIAIAALILLILLGKRKRKEEA